MRFDSIFDDCKWMDEAAEREKKRIDNEYEEIERLAKLIRSDIDKLIEIEKELGLRTEEI